MGFKPKKGDAPQTGRVRPSSNFERTMALASQIAAESVPEEHTVTANEQAPAVVAPGVLATPTAPPDAPVPPIGVPAAVPQPSASAVPGDLPAIDPAATPEIAALGGIVAAPAGQGRATASDVSSMPPSPTPTGRAQLSTLRIVDIRRSPFQPKGRPSNEAVAAVRRALDRMGSIDALVGAEGHATFQALTAEAKRLAELAYSISRDGVRDPVEVRIAEDGQIEALSGHRRMAAAELVGLVEIPVLNRGDMSAVQAAATVLSGNLHREDFTPWQEAVLVTEVIAQRRADGLPADVRTIGAIMGYSHGRVSTLQTIRRVLSDELLGRLGELAAVEEALARYANYSRLEEVARIPDESRRETVLRRLLGLTEPAAPVQEPDAPPVFDHRPKRRGGFTIEVHRAIEELAPADAESLRELFATQLARLDARLRTVGRG